MRLLATLIAVSLIASQAHAASTARIKDLVDVQGVRSNELYGYGLVVGLNGSGDTEQTGFTQQALAGMLGRFGNRLSSKDIRVRNVAAVMVTARLQTFARPGTRIDISVASMGDARSLAGGVLLITPLTGADGAVYAVAQGPVQVGGYDVAAAGSFARKNQPNSGRVPDGATVEREVSVDLSATPIVLELRHPDATTASRIAAAVSAKLGPGTAKALDPAAVEIKPLAQPALPDGGMPLDGGAPLDPVSLLAQIELLEVESDDHARVVVSERTGTVVAGEHVRLRPAMVAHGGLTVNIASTPFVSQPTAFSQGRTVRGDAATIDAKEGQNRAVGLAATTTVDELVRALNTLGATPRDLIAILQALQAAGALDAEIEGALMGLLNPTDRSDLQTPEKAAQAMESMLLQRMLASAHLTGSSKAPGAGMHADLFVEALADAVTKSGGLGLAKELNQQTKTGASDDSEKNPKNNLPANPLGSGSDLETQLLTGRHALIGNGTRTDNSLGEP